MSEIERAIEHIADNVRFLQTHDYADNLLQAHELALTALKEKLAREKNAPLTWNERINQMTVGGKARFITKMMNASVDSGTGRKSDVVCVDSLVLGARTWLCDYPNCEQCFELFLASPYTEGETK